jgi:transcriptional regulator with XRE-family HTH domain
MSRSQRAIGRLVGRAAEHRVSMTRLADAADVTRVTLSNWRSGRSIPSLEKYLAVEDALNDLINEKTGGN